MTTQVARLGFLEAKSSLFMLCDLQEKFRAGMRLYDAVLKNTDKLIRAGRFLDIPLVVTEHYPAKLGKIVKELDVTHARGIFPKTLFSMMTPEVKAKIAELFPAQRPLQTVVLFGIEAHICLEQTAMDLLAQGLTVHVVADCSMSRSLEDRALALKRLQQIGCFVTTSESVIFKLMRDKEHPKFDDVRKLVIEPSLSTELAKL